MLFQLQQRAKAGGSVPNGSAAAAGATAGAAAAAGADDLPTRLEQAQQVVSQLGEQALQSKLVALDQNIAKVYKALPPNGVLMVITGQGDTHNAIWQTELRYKRQQQLEGYERWTTADEVAYAALCESAMTAVCFCLVKHAEQQ
jgi:hypothetical protein